MDTFPLEAFHIRHKKPYITTGYKNPHNFYTFFIYENSGYGADKVERGSKGDVEDVSKRMQNQRIKRKTDEEKRRKEATKRHLYYYDMYVEDDLGIEGGLPKEVVDAIRDLVYEDTKDAVHNLQKEERAEKRKAEEDKAYDAKRRLEWEMHGKENRKYEDVQRLDEAMKEFKHTLEENPFWGLHMTSKTVSYQGAMEPDSVFMGSIEREIEINNEDYTSTATQRPRRSDYGVPRDRMKQIRMHSEMNKAYIEEQERMEEESRIIAQGIQDMCVMTRVDGRMKAHTQRR